MKYMHFSCGGGGEIMCREQAKLRSSCFAKCIFQLEIGEAPQVCGRHSHRLCVEFCGTTSRCWMQCLSWLSPHLSLCGGVSGTSLAMTLHAFSYEAAVRAPSRAECWKELSTGPVWFRLRLLRFGGAAELTLAALVYVSHALMRTMASIWQRFFRRARNMLLLWVSSCQRFFQPPFCPSDCMTVPHGTESLLGPCWWRVRLQMPSRACGTHMKLMRASIGEVASHWSCHKWPLTGAAPWCMACPPSMKTFMSLIIDASGCHFSSTKLICCIVPYPDQLVFTMFKGNSCYSHLVTPSTPPNDPAPEGC